MLLVTFPFNQENSPLSRKDQYGRGYGGGGGLGGIHLNGQHVRLTSTSFFGRKESD